MRLRYVLPSLASLAGVHAQDLVTVLQSDPDLSTLLGAIQAVPGLADTLNAAVNITVFAPTNAAFANVSADSLEGQAIANSDIDGIASILSYHVVPVSIPASAITAEPQFVQTLLTSDNVFAGASATLVTGGQYVGAQLVDGTSVVLASGLLSTSTVTQADIAAGGAIVHKIDAVLTVPRNASTTAQAAGFTDLVDALVSAELADTVDNLADVTVFIPTNAAFESISSTTATLTQAQLQDVLTLHVLNDAVVYSPSIPCGTTSLPTVNGEDVTVVNNGTILVDQATVIAPNVVLRNGAAHVIDSGSTIPDPLSTEEHGRLFSAYRENYLLPNDGEEQDRLDLQHTAWKHILKGKLYLASIVHPIHTLDIGTGTGIWAIEFAKQHPDTKIIGTDISLIQPSETAPPNVKFEREDSEQEWLFDHPFDFIHWRLMVSCFNDFEAMIRKCFYHLRPGGWAEFQEGTFELIPADDAAAKVLKGSALEKAFQAGPAAGAAIGRDFNAPKKYKNWMIEAGFVDVVEEQRLIPINSRPVTREDKLIGSWQSLNFLKLAGGLGKMLQSAGFPQEDLPKFQEQFRHDVTWAQMRVYFPIFVVYGRKP